MTLPLPLHCRLNEACEKGGEFEEDRYYWVLVLVLVLVLEQGTLSFKR